MQAHPDGASQPRSSAAGAPKPGFDRLLNAFSLVTMAMTVPQALSVWRGHAQGVSILSWATYLVSAFLWLAYGLRKRDRTIYIPCLGWIALDAAIVFGILIRGGG
jgi:uncharacterized protein with PQ loop repeat